MPAAEAAGVLDMATILKSLVASGPVALVLFYWSYSERKERRELQTKLLEVLTQTAKLGEATRDSLKEIRDLVQEGINRGRR